MEDIEVQRIRVLPPWFTPEAKPHGGKPAAARNMEAACTRGAALDYSDANRLGRHRGEYTPRQGAQKRWAARGTRSYASKRWDLPTNTKGERSIGH